MNDREIRAKALDFAIRIVQPTSKDFSRDERGNILVGRELYDTFINIARFLGGVPRDEKILNDGAQFYPFDRSE
jgi:hypothetical protein